MADLTPEHTARHPDSDSYSEVIAAYRYVQSVVSTADVQSPVGGYAWHGWALREAFLAGCTYVHSATSQPAPPADGEVAELVDEARYLVRELSDQADDLNPSLELFGLMNQAAANLARTAELLQQMEDLAADAVAGLRYIEESCGRLYGVGWDRVYGKADRLKPAHALPLPEVNNG